MKLWIKERHNSQLGTYYVACGEVPLRVARRMENPLHGSNKMHGYDTERAYEEALETLRRRGERIQ